MKGLATGVNVQRLLSSVNKFVLQEVEFLFEDLPTVAAHTGRVFTVDSAMVCRAVLQAEGLSTYLTAEGLFNLCDLSGGAESLKPSGKSGHTRRTHRTWFQWALSGEQAAGHGSSGPSHRCHGHINGCRSAPPLPCSSMPGCFLRDFPHAWFWKASCLSIFLLG